MNVNLGEGTSDGRVQRSDNHNPFDPNIEIKQEIEIKEEPMENVELIEYPWESPTVEVNMVIESESGSNSHADDGSANDYVKEEIKREENESRRNKQPNQPAGNRKQPRLNVKGKNRILSQKRNMANAKKESRAKPKRVHKCQQCDYSTLIKSNLTQHIRTHTGDKPFECEICAKSFTQKVGLNQHKKIHRSQFAFHCSKCLTGFAKEADKNNHENKCRCRRRHFECYSCKYSILHMTNLQRHMRVHHTGQKPFKSEVSLRIKL